MTADLQSITDFLKSQRRTDMSLIDMYKLLKRKFKTVDYATLQALIDQGIIRTKLGNKPQASKSMFTKFFIVKQLNSMKQYIRKQVVNAEPMTIDEALNAKLVTTVDCNHAFTQGLRGYRVSGLVPDEDIWMSACLFEEQFTPAGTPVERMQIEHAELTDNLGKLTKFIDSEKFESLDVKVKDLLERQQFIMTRYEKVLQERLSIMQANEAQPGSSK